MWTSLSFWLEYSYAWPYAITLCFIPEYNPYVQNSESNPDFCPAPICCFSHEYREGWMFRDRRIERQSNIIYTSCHLWIKLVIYNILPGSNRNPFKVSIQVFKLPYIFTYILYYLNFSYFQNHIEERLYEIDRVRKGCRKFYQNSWGEISDQTPEQCTKAALPLYHSISRRLCGERGLA